MGRADFQFEVANLSVQWRLRRVKPPRMRETAFYGHSNEVAQMTDFHRSYPYLEGIAKL
jgi:hypothetical protein